MTEVECSFHFKLALPDQHHSILLMVVFQLNSRHGHKAALQKSGYRLSSLISKPEAMVLKEKFPEMTKKKLS